MPPTGIDSPWASESIRVFISHLAEEGVRATQLKIAMEAWGLDGFVAHLDIDPGAQWATEIETALASCDALVAILTDGFGASAWCDQEVGWALGRNVPVIPVRVDLAPYGLLGSTQAVRWLRTIPAADEVAKQILMVLIRDPRMAARAIDSMVGRLERAESFARANAIAGKLVELRARLTPAQFERLDRAALENSQVLNAYDVGPALVTLRELVAPEPL